MKGPMSGRVITFGEVMLRLKSPGHERFPQSPVFEAILGSGKAHLAVSLADFSLDAAYVTVLPHNPIADASVTYLQSRDVDTSLIVHGGERMGIYFLESGANQRTSHPHPFFYKSTVGRHDCTHAPPGRRCTSYDRALAPCESGYPIGRRVLPNRYQRLSDPRCAARVRLYDHLLEPTEPY